MDIKQLSKGKAIQREIAERNETLKEIENISAVRLYKGMPSNHYSEDRKSKKYEIWNLGYHLNKKLNEAIDKIVEETKQEIKDLEQKFTEL